MNSTFSQTSLVKCITALALVAALPLADARDAKFREASQDQKQERSPPRLRIDEQPIDRSAPDRVSYAPIVEKSAQSVVFVYSTKQVRPQEMAPFLKDPMLRRFFGAPGSPGAPGSRGGRMPEQSQRGLGSGVIVSPDGYILTNNLVVEGADEVKVSIGESLARHDATVVGSDPLADIAVLKIEADGLKPATAT